MSIRRAAHAVSGHIRRVAEFLSNARENRRRKALGSAVRASIDALERRTLLSVNVTVSSDASGNEITENNQVHLSVAAETDDSGSNLEDNYTVKWGDGTSDTWNGGWSGNGSGNWSDSADTPTHTYMEANCYTIEVDVTADWIPSWESNQGSASIYVFNVDEATPSVGASGNSSILAGSTYTLNTSFSDPGGDSPNDWHIDWGDGSSETDSPASSFTHTFSTDGSHTITATAQTEDGNYSATQGV
jgi:hypothetical protein